MKKPTKAAAAIRTITLPSGTFIVQDPKGGPDKKFIGPGTIILDGGEVVGGTALQEANTG